MRRARATSLQPLRLLQIGAVIGPVLLLAIAGSLLWQQERHRAEREAQQSVEVLREHVGRLVESQELLLSYVDSLVRDLSWEEIARSDALRLRLGSLVRRSELTRSIALIDSSGILRMTDAMSPVPPTDLSDREYFRVLRERDEPLAIGERISSRLRNEDLFTFAQRRGADGFDGVIAAGISVRHFQTFFETLRTDQRTAITLVRLDGVVLARAPASPLQTLGPATALRQAATNAERGLYETVSPIDGIRRMVSFARVPGHPLIVTYAMAKAALWEKWTRQMGIAAAGAALLAALGLALASTAVRRQSEERQFREALQAEVETRTAELRGSEARAHLLAHEVDHRAKNMLAVVQAIVHMSRGEDTAAFRQTIEGRVTALARAHSLLSESRWEGADLGRLVDEELAPYRRETGTRIEIDGPSLALGHAAAQSLAMALHELATNALKHGALGLPDGRLHVAWRTEPGTGLVLRWRESGGARTVPPERRGLGMNVIQRSVRDQLRGSVAFDWLEAGLLCEIRVPAEQLAAATRAA